MMKIPKKEKLNNFLSILKVKLEPFAKHIFDAKWQAQQFKKITMAVPEKWAVMCLDFAENFTCLWQDEVQGAHWSYDQVTLHPIVSYYNCPKENCKNIVEESIMFIERNRPERQSLKAVKGTRTYYSFRCIQEGIVTHRERSCFCESCITSQGKCENEDLLGKWIVSNLKKRVVQRRNVRARTTKIDDNMEEDGHSEDDRMDDQEKGRTDEVDEDHQIEGRADDVDEDGQIEERADEADGDGQIEERADEADGDGQIEERADEVDEDGQIEGRADEVDEDGQIEGRGDKVDEDGQIEERADEVDEDGPIEGRADEVDEDGQIEGRGDKEDEDVQIEGRAGEVDEDGPIEGRADEVDEDGQIEERTDEKGQVEEDDQIEGRASKESQVDEDDSTMEMINADINQISFEYDDLLETVTMDQKINEDHAKYQVGDLECIVIKHGASLIPGVVDDWPWVRFFCKAKNLWTLNDTQHTILHADVHSKITSPDIVMCENRILYKFSGR
ncbi:Hypothetical predicted protein [Mytilus galloprovincialis]|uniref:Uncharacterized protein n=1 Tax=Mytilus galloprovincialis TaxID=29158 RepID=A0A8B6D1Y1_MYTGA|nr:Hypothetical predicted protein [Mytilus galloprovincialis]